MGTNACPSPKPKVATNAMEVASCRSPRWAPTPALRPNQTWLPTLWRWRAPARHAGHQRLPFAQTKRGHQRYGGGGLPLATLGTNACPSPKPNVATNAMEVAGSRSPRWALNACPQIVQGHRESKIKAVSHWLTAFWRKGRESFSASLRKRYAITNLSGSQPCFHAKRATSG